MGTAALLLSACGSAPVQWPADTVVEAPLVAAWRAVRPLVEVQIDGGTPVLFVVDPGTVGVEVASEYADRLGLPTMAPGRAVSTVPDRRLTLGGVTATAALTLVEETQPSFHERAVVGVLGRGVFAGRRLEIDPERGVVRISDEAPAPNAAPIEIDPGDWSVPVRFGSEDAGLVLGFLDSVGQLTATVAEAAGLTAHLGHKGPVAWVGAARLGALHERPLAYAAASSGPSRTGYALFQDLVIDLDARAEDPVLRLRPAGPADRGRFPDSPDCGPDGAACVSGRVSAVRPERIELTFDTPSVALPDPLWARVAFGDRDNLSVLVQLRPRGVIVRDQGPEQILRTWVKFPALPPGYLVAPDDPLRLVDVVLMKVKCPGEVCVQSPRLHPRF